MSQDEVGSVMAHVLQPQRDGAGQPSMVEQAVSSKPVRQP